MSYLSAKNSLLTAGGKLLVYGDVVQVAPEPVVPVGGDLPTDKLGGWWDASVLALGAFNGILDRSGNGKGMSVASVVVPRLAGMLSGVCALTRQGNYAVQHPVIGNTTMNIGGLTVGAGGQFTVCMVWSRPNKRQPDSTTFSDETVSLMMIDSKPLLSLTGLGDGNDSFVLFPGANEVRVGKLELRHTHCARVVFNGSTVDLWLDGQKIVTGAANQITLGATALLSLLANAQCVFHEAAVWSKALTATEHAILSGYTASKWPLGPRPAANGIMIGQSNAGNFLGSFSRWPFLNNAIAYWTGNLSSNLLWATDNILAGDTVFSGRGIYDGSANLFLDSSKGGDPSTWGLGADGRTFKVAMDSMTPDRLANLFYVAWFWSESDTANLTYADKAKYTAAMKRAFYWVRQLTGKSAVQLPILVISALPFGATDAGCQVHREVMADLIADPALNVRMMLAQTDDAIGQNSTWDSTTGVESGGNGAHRDADDMTEFARRMAMPISRAVVAAQAAAGVPDAIKSIDATVPQIGGPRVASAHYEGGTSVLVTLEHDGGNDLVLPRRAVLGVGWTLMDGVDANTYGTPGTHGALITATACVKVNATQVRLTLASAPSFPTKAKIYYAFGSGLDSNACAIISRGNAVTDNFSAMTLAPGWRVGVDRGPNEQLNNPLQATLYGVALS